MIWFDHLGTYLKHDVSTFNLWRKVVVLYKMYQKRKMCKWMYIHIAVHDRDGMVAVLINKVTETLAASKGSDFPSGSWAVSHKSILGSDSY